MKLHRQTTERRGQRGEYSVSQYSKYFLLLFFVLPFEMFFLVGSRPLQLICHTGSGLQSSASLPFFDSFYVIRGLKCSHLPSTPMQPSPWYSPFPSLTRPDSSVSPCQKPSAPPSASPTSCTSTWSSCFWVSSPDC